MLNMWVSTGTAPGWSSDISRMQSATLGPTPCSCSSAARASAVPDGGGGLLDVLGAVPEPELPQPRLHGRV